MGFKDIIIENEEGRVVWWMDELLEGIEFEHDLDAVRKARSKISGEKTSDLNEALLRMISQALRQSNCPIM
jgi:hypothetical protein